MGCTHYMGVLSTLFVKAHVLRWCHKWTLTFLSFGEYAVWVWKCLQLHTHEPRQIISFLPSFYTVASYQLNCGTGPRFTVIYRALKRRRLVNLFVTKIHFLQSILCTWMPTRTHTHTHKKQYAFAYKKRSSFCLEFAHFIVNFYIPRLICESNCAIWFRGNSKWN